MKKTWIIFAILIILILCIVLGTIFLVPRKTTQKLENEVSTVNITYPKNKGYEYKEVQNEMKTSEISKKDADFIISIQIDTQTIGYWYNEDFEKYKEGRGASLDSSDININGVNGFAYYDSQKDEYQIILPISEKATLSISVQPMVRFSGDNGKKIYERQDIKDIINTIKITKK